MLMAAGLGTRLVPFTLRTPKPLLPVLGVPLAQFSVDALANAGVTAIVANVHHLAHEAITGLHRLELGHAHLAINDERRELQGSAGGLRDGVRTLGGGPVYLANADVLCDLELARLAHRHQELRHQHGVELTLAVLPQGAPGGRYRQIHSDPATGLMTQLGDFAEGTPFFASLAIVEEGALAHVPRSGPAEFIPQILLPLLKQRKVGVFPVQFRWHDIGSPPLWHAMHLDLIRGMESGNLPTAWRQRIVASAAALRPGVWVAKADFEHARQASQAWVGPCFWSSDGDPNAQPPVQLGPGGVIYGDTTPSGAGAPGIGYHGLWQDLP